MKIGLFLKGLLKQVVTLWPVVIDMYKDREFLEKYGVKARKYVVEHFERADIAEDLHLALKKIATSDEFLLSLSGGNEYDYFLTWKGLWVRQFMKSWKMELIGEKSQNVPGLMPVSPL